MHDRGLRSARRAHSLSEHEPVLLHEFFWRSLPRHAALPAIEVPPGLQRPARSVLSYGQLGQQAARIARALAEVAAPDAIVCVLLPRTSALPFAAQLGINTAGAAYACFDPAYPDAALARIFADAAPVATITSAALAARCRGLGVPCGLLLEIETLLAAPDPGEVAPPAWLAGHHLAYVIYTSGTTGAPKGVMIEHRSIANLVASDLVAFAPGPEDRVLQGSSLAYDSSLEEVWLALASGGCVVVADDETVRRGPDLLPWLRAERISVLCPTPTLLRALGCREPQRELPQLRLVYAGGEALPRDLAELWSQGRHFENGYGPTECTVTVVRGPVHRGEEVSIGRPVRGHRALILDQALAEVPEGEVGELHIAGIGLARGYLGRAEATAERFVQHPRHGRIYRTGDLARRTSDGRIFCLGRADAQVKLRGHRLELEAIEAAIAECPGVRTAACRIAGQEPQQVLEALVIASNGTLPDAAGLRATLRQNLPAPMVPGRIAFVPALPTAVSGKLDRRALSALAVAFPPLARSGGAPQNELEQRVHAAFTAVLRGSDIGRDDDFFFDLGGDSLRAAEIVSQLRRDPRTSSIAVRDLYEARTVAAVAARAASTPAGPAAAPLPMAPMFGISHPIATACVQAVWLLLGVGAGALAGFALLFLVVPWLGNLLGWNGLLALLPLLLFAGTLLWCAGTVLLTVTAKWLLLGRYRALRVRVASSYYLRHWLVQHCASLVPWGLLQGTALCSTALRVLGARVGKRLHVHRGVDLSLGGWDLLQLGDDVSLGQDAMLELVSLDAGYLVVGPVALGDGATLETRAGVAAHAQLEPGACLAALSSLPAHRRIPRGERWDGVPAAPAGAAPAPPVPDLPSRELSPMQFTFALLLLRLLFGYGFQAPYLLLIGTASLYYGVDSAQVIDWLAAPTLTLQGALVVGAVTTLATVLGLLARALLMRALGEVPAGVLGRWTSGYLRVWTKDGIVQATGDWLSGTLFWPAWLRLAGMQVGSDCEISTILDVVPERVRIGDASFLADGIYLGSPRVHRGTVTIGDTRLGNDTFLGNHVVVPSGQQLPPRILLGISTPAERIPLRQDSGWFGHPAFELPRREVIACDRRLTHDPTPLRYATRVFWEALRFVLPLAPLALGTLWITIVDSATDLGPRLLLAMAATAGVMSAATGGVLALKWLLLGRVRPAQHPLWSCWCSRWDFLYVAWGYLAHGLLTQLKGTPFLVFYLRAMGCTIGRQVVLGNGFAQVVDPDMLTIADGATVDCMFQAHSFEDRVLKIDHVRIGRNATVGRGAVLLYGADIGEGARVEPHSVVMKHERLLPGVVYVGSPTRPVTVAG